MVLVQRKKYVDAVAILGTAVLLTCLGILFDAVVQTKSTVGLIAWSVPLAISVAAVLMGFNWVLEKWVDSAAIESGAPVQKQRVSYSRFNPRNSHALKGSKMVA
jgi:hypothetical protein